MATIHRRHILIAVFALSIAIVAVLPVIRDFRNSIRKANERQQSANKVLEAYQLTSIDLASGHFVVLKTETGYAAITAANVQNSHFKVNYRIYFSTNGLFTEAMNAAQEGSVENSGPTHFSVGGGGVAMGSTGGIAFWLEPGDTNTGLAEAPTTNLSQIDGTKLKYSFNKPVNDADFIKAFNLAPSEK